MSKADGATGSDEEMAALIKAEMKLLLDRTREGGMAEGLAAIAEYEAELRKEEREENFSKLLAERDGDLLRLAHDLHHHIYEKWHENLQVAAQQIETKSSGRPARRWGSDGVAKRSLVKIIDAVVEAKHEEENAKPKTRDAIACALGIPENERHRDKQRRRIDAIASAYSQGKALILKEK